jgi:hypothetical protein
MKRSPEENTMSRLFLIGLIIALVVGCATVPEENVGRQDRPDGTPIQSTSEALLMAKMLLRTKGLGVDNRSVGISFCDGIYTITFKKPENSVTAKDYAVNIEAKSGKIVSVVTDR